MLKKELLTRKKFNFLKRFYDKTWDPSGHTLHVGLFDDTHTTLPQAYQNATDYLISKINQSLPLGPDAVVLDVGCGTGRTLLEICAKYKCKGVGVDISDEQIKDARQHLKKLNKTSKKVDCTFIRGSASQIGTLIRGQKRFTHIISQDSLLLVINKQQCFEGLYKLLKYNGILAITDFLSESTINNKKESKLIKQFVNWDKSLSLEEYQDILNQINFQIIHSEIRDRDMIKTYELLATNMKPFVKSDEVYQNLHDRYNAITKAVKNKQMSWGIFVAKKMRKQVVIAGTKQKSIGRFVGKYLYKLGWEVWLYSRHAQNVNRDHWHERPCDISNEKDVKNLLCEIETVDMALMLADSDGHGLLASLSERKIADFINAKLTGSVLLSKTLATQYPTPKKPITLIWCAGKLTPKPADLILYGMVNPSIASYVKELNNNYAHLFRAYYLPLGPISPSTLGDEYIRKAGAGAKKVAQHPQVIIDAINKIMGEE